jgi:hypothetical protein
MLKMFTLSGATLLMLALPSAAQQTPAQSQRSQQTQKDIPDNGGVRTAVPATVQTTYYTLQQSDLRASDLIGMDVYNSSNEDIGEIKDLILEDGKNLKAILIDVGGFLGLGERTIAVTPPSLLIQKRAGSDRAIINATKDSLNSAPEFQNQALAR